MRRSLAAKKGGRNLALWPFALKLYAKPGVAASCLALQDRYGVDIPLLLAAIWHGHGGRGRLDPARRRIWRAAARNWRTAVIGPLRGARAALRMAAKQDPAIGKLRRSILAAELAAEKLLLRDLVALSAVPHVREPHIRYVDARANAEIFVRVPRALTKIFSALAPKAWNQGPDRKRVP
ncbi:MAG: TIGR02444 family protein [Proteobacteria bacterium]|nr:TIGR02444 family protein [Pseudomonadota bacterium]